MSDYSDETKNDDFMRASAEEWSKPTPPAERPPAQPEPTDRWGSPISDKSTSNDPVQWGTETSSPVDLPSTETKSGSKWWILLIIVLVLLCLCACLVIFAIPSIGELFFQKISWISCT